MTIEKRYLKNKPVCKVTFRIPGELGNPAREAHVVGEFNGWSLSEHPMRRLKNGSFRATLDLEKGRSYQFRYLLDQGRWESDPAADDQTPTPYGDGFNSVITL